MDHVQRTAIMLRLGGLSAATEARQTKASANMNVKVWRWLHLDVVWECRRRTRHSDSNLSRQLFWVVATEAWSLLWHIQLCWVANDS